MKREVVRGEPLSTYLENRKAPASAVTRVFTCVPAWPGPLDIATVRTVFRLSLILLVLACALPLRLAHAVERPGDATYVYELQQHARTATALRNEFLGLFEATSGEESFNLYWTYNVLMGTWAQVDLLQSMLDFSIATASPSDEEALRTALRGQAQFLLWELGNANAQLEQNVPEVKRPVELRNNVAIRLLLSHVRITVSRLLVDLCAREPCASHP